MLHERFYKHSTSLYNEFTKLQTKLKVKNKIKQPKISINSMRENLTSIIVNYQNATISKLNSAQIYRLSREIQFEIRVRKFYKYSI